MELSGKLIKGTGSYAVSEVAPISVKGQLLTNSGGKGQTDWVDTDGDGLADGWTINTLTSSIVTGNGFIGNAQRGVGVNGSELRNLSATMVSGRTYKLSYKYRSSHGLNVFSRSSQLIKSNVANTSDAIYVEITFLCTFSSYLMFYFTVNEMWAEIDEVSLEEVPKGYPLLDQGDKVLQCTSPGTVSILSDVAYGTWEWDFYYTINTTISMLFIVEKDGTASLTGSLQGFDIHINSGETLFLINHKGGSFTAVCSTAAGYMTTGYYRIKITRTLDGEFTVYIKSEAEGYDDWTLLPVSSGNPGIDTDYTSCKLFTIYGYSANLSKIANIKITNQVKQ